MYMELPSDPQEQEFPPGLTGAIPTEASMEIIFKTYTASLVSEVEGAVERPHFAVFQCSTKVRNDHGLASQALSRLIAV